MLGASDLPCRAHAGLEAHLGDLSAFAAACLPGDNDHRVLFDQADDLLRFGRDRQIGGKGDGRLVFTTGFPFRDRCLRPAFQRIQSGFKIPGSSPESLELPQQFPLVPEHHVGNEGLNFLYLAFRVHGLFSVYSSNSA